MGCLSEDDDILFAPKVKAIAHPNGILAMPTERKASPVVTREMAAHIRFLVRAQGLYQHQAAALLGINPGRVNEVIKGHRFPEEPPAQKSFPF